MHVALLVGTAVVIYVACEWFVNAIEWLGLHLRIGPIAVGTILAAVGTALPESVVTFVAVVFGHSATFDAIGMGAALGGPLVLATIAYAVVGFVLLLRGRRQVVMRNTRPASGNPAWESDSDVEVPTKQLVRDQRWFLAVFVVKVGLGLVTFAVKPWLGFAFFAVYIVYFIREVSAGGEHDESTLEPLKLTPRTVRPHVGAVVAQTVGALAAIFVASQLFVDQLAWAGKTLGLSASVVALLLSPVATELPETIKRPHLGAARKDTTRARQYFRSDDDSGNGSERFRVALHAVAVRRAASAVRPGDHGGDRLSARDDRPSPAEQRPAGIRGRSVRRIRRRADLPPVRVGRPLGTPARAGRRREGDGSRRSAGEAASGKVEPPRGFEPRTYALRVRCSAG